ncbi:MAG: hypothetical protein PHE38_12660 [Alishewanella agri]|nr:hypothetical protein [Alishewanella agri]
MSFCLYDGNSIPSDKTCDEWNSSGCWCGFTHFPEKKPFTTNNFAIYSLANDVLTQLHLANIENKHFCIESARHALLCFLAAIDCLSTESGDNSQ